MNDKYKELITSKENLLAIIDQMRIRRQSFIDALIVVRHEIAQLANQPRTSAVTDQLRTCDNSIAVMNRVLTEIDASIAQHNKTVAELDKRLVLCNQLSLTS